MKSADCQSLRNLDHNAFILRTNRGFMASYSVNVTAIGVVLFEDC